MSKKKEQIVNFLKGQAIRPTKVHRKYSLDTSKEIRIKNKKDLWIILLIIAIGAFALLTTNEKMSFFHLYEMNPTGSIILAVAYFFGLSIYVYVGYFDKKEKLIINQNGIEAPKEKLSLKWSEIKETSLFNDSKANWKIFIKTHNDQEYKIPIYGLEKRPEEISHYVELFKQNHAFKESYA